MSPSRLLSALLIFSPAIVACGSDLGNVSSTRSDFETKPVIREGFDAALRAVCGEGGLTSAGTDAIRRAPYVQKMTDSSVEILWTSTATEAQEVIVRTGSGEEVATVEAQVDQQSNRDEFDQYVAEIDGLEPGQVYCYELRGESDTWMASTGFRTAPITGEDANVQILVMGDLGTQTSDQFAVLSQLENVPFDLALVAGDLAYEKGTLSDHENNFFAVYANVLKNIPFFPISGNHDYAADGSIFREVFALPENGGTDGVERWYSFDWGPIHLVALDTEQTGDVQARWLEADLQANEQEWTIVFLHRPPYSSGSHGSTASVQEFFVPLFEGYGVDLVLAGHDHDYERTTPINGVTYVVTGSGGRGTRPVGSSSFTAYSEAVAHFTYVELKDGELQVTAIDASGNEFDAVSLRP